MGFLYKHNIVISCRLYSSSLYGNCYFCVFCVSNMFWEYIMVCFGEMCNHTKIKYVKVWNWWNSVTAKDLCAICVFIKVMMQNTAVKSILYKLLFICEVWKLIVKQQFVPLLTARGHPYLVWTGGCWWNLKNHTPIVKVGFCQKKDPTFRYFLVKKQAIRVAYSPCLNMREPSSPRFGGLVLSNLEYHHSYMGF